MEAQEESLVQEECAGPGHVRSPGSYEHEYSMYSVRETQTRSSTFI